MSSLRTRLLERLEGRLTMNQHLLSGLHRYGGKYQMATNIDDAIAVAKAQARADAYQNAMRDVEELFGEYARRLEQEHASAYVKAGGPVV